MVGLESVELGAIAGCNAAARTTAGSPRTACPCRTPRSQRLRRASAVRRVSTRRPWCQHADRLDWIGSPGSPHADRLGRGVARRGAGANALVFLAMLIGVPRRGDAVTVPWPWLRCALADARSTCGRPGLASWRRGRPPIGPRKVRISAGPSRPPAPPHTRLAVRPVPPAGATSRGRSRHRARALAPSEQWHDASRRPSSRRGGTCTSSPRHASELSVQSPAAPPAASPAAPLPTPPPSAGRRRRDVASSVTAPVDATHTLPEHHTSAQPTCPRRKTCSVSQYSARWLDPHAHSRMEAILRRVVCGVCRRLP